MEVGFWRAEGVGCEVRVGAENASSRCKKTARELSNSSHNENRVVCATRGRRVMVGFFIG